MLKKLYSTAVALCVMISVLTCVLPALNVSAAAGNAELRMSAYKWDTSSHSESLLTSSSALYEGDVLLLKVFTPAPINKLSGVRFTVEYNSSLLTYADGSASCVIPDSNGALNTKTSVSAGTNKGTVTFLWDTSSDTGADVTDVMFVLRFMVPAQLDGGTADFKLDVLEMYNSDYDLFNVNTSNAAVSVKLEADTVKGTQLSNLINAIAKLASKPVNLVEFNNNSRNNILAAENLFKLLNKNQMTWFSLKYPAEYSDFSTAWTRYYSDAEKKSLQSVLDAWNDFIGRHQTALALKENQINTKNIAELDADIALLLALQSEYNSMDEAVKARINSEDKAAVSAQIALISKYRNRKEDLIGADMDVEEFDSYWAYLLTFGEAELNDALTALIPIEDALRWFDGVGDIAKERLLNERKLLQDYHEKLLYRISQDENLQKILSEVRNYQSIYEYVVYLSAAEVDITDEAAVKMALEAYDNLSKEAREVLSGKADTLRKMLLIIEELKKTDEEAIRYEEIIREKIEYVNQTVEVPVEVPVEVIVEKTVLVKSETKGETEANTETVNKPDKGSNVKAMTSLVWWMLLLLGGGLLLMGWRIYELYRTKSKTGKGVGVA